MKIGFIGLGNVGRKLAGDRLNNKHELVLRDIKKDLALDFINDGAEWAESPKELAELSDIIITCLPSPEACSKVMEDKDDGIFKGLDLEEEKINSMIMKARENWFLEEKST